MVLAASILFFGSLLGIVALFALKAWEIQRGRLLAPELRIAADQKSLGFKSLLASQRPL
jgi:hypothetical protein